MYQESNANTKNAVTSSESVLPDGPYAPNNCVDLFWCFFDNKKLLTSSLL